MKIVIVRHSIRSRGGDKLVLEYMSYLADQGHQISYWINEVNTSFLINSKIKIKKIPIPGILGTILFVFLKHFESDVLLVDLVVMSYFASFRNKNKLLYLAQDYDVTYHKQTIIKNFIEHCYRQTLSKWAIKTIAVSEHLSEKLKKYSPKDIQTISNGVDLQFFKREPSSAFLVKRQKEKVILFFARKDFRKGLDVAIKAIEELAIINKRNNWEVWTIGTERVTMEGISVNNMGFLKTDEEIRSIMSAADIYLLPSRSEGLSLLLLQALACQCAVVSTEAGNILTDEVNGLVTPIEDWKKLADNLNRILTDNALKQKLRENGRRLAEQYSLEKSCKYFEKNILSFSQPCV